MAKNQILSHLPPHATEFIITAFREDTMQQSVHSFFRKSIVYALDYKYNDSTGKLMAQRANVVFTPDGRSVISSSIQPQ
ncbi:MAG: hypothetical protein M3Y85_04115 [Bacteroidota bacterium]|nr:hypothetical protein [Bacteroidota bacterium]